MSAAELKINLRPFSRSRSSGNNGSRPRMVAGSTASATRKVSSEPCSRCNSAGESKTSRKWPSSPSPVGVHLARNDPISHVRRGGVIGRSSDAMLKSSAEKSASKLRNDGHRKIPFAESGGSADGGEKAGVLNLNIPLYGIPPRRHHLSCSSDENSAVSVVAEAGESSGLSVEGGSGDAVRSRLVHLTFGA